MNSGPEDPERKKSPWIQVGRYSQIAFMLPAGTVAGYFLGALVDKWLHLTWASMVGLILGTVAGIIELLRTVLRDTK
jgi:F0F1-type ATP synthase assembly protein I